MRTQYAKLKGGGDSNRINPQDFADRIRALPVRDGVGVDHEWHIFFDETKPAALYGGTWEELAQGTFIMAAGSGGVASLSVDNHGNPNGMHTMTVDELVSHNHLQQYSQNATSGFYQTVKASAGQNVPLTSSYDSTTGTGGGKAFDIRPPTITAHFWRRVS